MAQLVIAVVGPTAAGKSELSLRLARALDAEVINADSMQLYKGMDIGTGKLTPAERGGVPHHLLDIWDVTEPASVAEYQRLASAAVAEVAARGKTPLLVGGSGLYVRAVIDDFAFPGTDPLLRSRLEAELAEVGAGALHARLAAADPEAAAAILPTNGRRVVRALEVIELTGRPFGAVLPGYDARAGGGHVGRGSRTTGGLPAVQIGLDVPRDELDRRIAARVSRMWRAGLVHEVEGLDRVGLRYGRTAGRALGYAQALRFLDGDWTAEEAQRQTVAATRRFARRQESWFRRDPRVRWLPADQPVPTDVAVAALSESAGSDS